LLWTLLKLTSSLTFLIAAIQAVQQAHAGFVMGTFCVTVGVVLGACNLLGMTTLEQKFERYTTKLSSTEAERRLRAIYLAAFLWIFLAAYLAERLITFVIRHA
jgi:hypothetical protein